MSVLIKGMEMPTNCDSCLFDDGVHCMAYPPSEDLVYDIANGKPQWCPLVTVPPHGRLIDADELLQEHERIVSAWGDIHIVTAGAVKNAPTVIPAEPGEKET